ncbi:MAG TPA: Flp pilus assembly protein CpaB, partial [Actinomycetota bacterium]|nr:Flp pilus assembly protein CpaB [Actinomycetota bacterium]
IIPAGTSIDEAVRRGAIAKTTIPRKVVADGAIASLDQVRGKIAAVTIVKGEQIVEARFASAEEVASGLPIPADRQAFAIEVDTPHGVAGFIQPGSRVSVIAHLEATAPSSNVVVKRSQFLLQDIQVLAVGERIAVSVSGDRDAAKVEQDARSVDNKVLLTLALTASEAERLAYALYEGDVHFTLLPQGHKPAKTPGRTGINVFR